MKRPFATMDLAATAHMLVQALQRAPLGLYMAALAASVLMWPSSGWRQVGPRVGAGTAASMGALTCRRILVLICNSRSPANHPYD